MPLYVGDYLRDTQHLTAEQHGAYLLLLMACWTMGTLPDDRRQLVQIAKIGAKKWSVIACLLDTFFIHAIDGSWHQKRIDKERERAEIIKEARSKAGSKGSAKRWQNDNKSHSKTIARARVPQPQPHTDTSLRGRRLRPGASARQRAGGALAPAPAGEAREQSDRAPVTPAATVGGFKTAGRALPPDVRAPFPETSQENPDAGLRAAANDREKLRQRAYDFAAQRYPDAQRRAAFLGLGGGDPEHDAEWWLDTLGELMEVEQWQQT